MKIVGKNVCPDKATFVAARVYDCVNTLKNPKYGLNLPYEADEIAISRLEVKNRPNTSSRANHRVIRINLGYWQIGNKVRVEYKSFNDDPIIGKAVCRDAYDHLLITVSHEISHHIQYLYCPDVQKFVHTYRKPHGTCFKAIYKYLRRDYVNPMLESNH